MQRIFGVYPNSFRHVGEEFDNLGDEGQERSLHTEELKKLMEISHVLLNCKDVEVLKALENYREALTNVNVAKDTIEKTHTELLNVLKKQEIDIDQQISKDVQKEAKKQFDEIQQVIPGLYIGGAAPARNKEYLKRHQITHVVQATEDSSVPHPYDFEYLKIEIPDYEDANIQLHFKKSNEFIEAAINNGKSVLVHCMAGISRSASLVLAFLVEKRSLTLNSAYQLLKTSRPHVFPNSGFRKQLRDFETKVKGSSSSVNT